MRTGERPRYFGRTEKDILGLPPAVAKAYAAAQKVRQIDSNAFAVLLGRVLEITCEDRGATGDSLFKQLKSLADAGEIPTHLEQMGNQLRHLRNVGAHASLGELTAGDVPILDALCRAVLEYVYSAPAMIRQVQRRIDERETQNLQHAGGRGQREYHINISGENSQYTAEIPDLIGCIGLGNTPTEALQALDSAKEAWIEAARTDGRRIPRPRYRAN